MVMWCLRDGWLYTGDLASQDEDGYVFIQGRCQETINVGGFKVYPREVEQTLRDCAAFGVPDERLGQVVPAWVIPAPGCAPDEQALRAYCALQLAHYKTPRRIAITEALPRTAVGKLARKELKLVGAMIAPRSVT